LTTTPSAVATKISAITVANAMPTAVVVVAINNPQAVKAPPVKATGQGLLLWVRFFYNTLYVGSLN